MLSSTQKDRIVEKTLAMGQYLRAQRALFSDSPNVVERKLDGSSVTEHDRYVEAELGSTFRDVCPGFTVIGEESIHEHPEAMPPAGYAANRGNFIWLDPLEGTAPWTRGANCYGINVGIFEQGSPVFAMFHQPERATYSAWFDGSGWKLDPVMQASSDARATDQYLYCGSDLHRFQLDWPGKVRALGATGAHLAMLLDGTEDPAACLVTRYKRWDTAAGLILCIAAGFEIRDALSGEPIDPNELWEAGRDGHALLVHRKGAAFPRVTERS